MARSLFAGEQGGLAGGCVQAVAKKGSFSDNSVCFAAGRLKNGFRLFMGVFRRPDIVPFIKSK
jgi:hypothetical protein